MKGNYKMEELIDRIKKDGDVFGEDTLKVDSFLNHQLDVNLLNSIGKEFYEHFKNKNITKILTVEASGIAIASIAAQYFNVPVVFAKKTESKNLDNDTYDAEVFSFTKGRTYTIKVSKKYIESGENILIVDDFLARGEAALGLCRIVESAGANVSGIGIAIEKKFQKGGFLLKEKNIDLYSLAVIEKFEDGRPIFE